MPTFLAAFFAALLVQALAAPSPPKIDFKRDVQPIFRAGCYSCHGPTQQMNGFRLDRRGDALRGGSIAVINRGSAEGSRFYQRLTGDSFGTRMPPTGALPASQIATIKVWLDQGADWPDDAAGEAPLPPPDAVATRLMDAIRAGNRSSWSALLASDPMAVNRKGPGGTTPLMYAALYGTASDMRLFLRKGADPKPRNYAGATALMWALDDPKKTELLLNAGADPNTKSDDQRTPLLIATLRYGSAPVVKLLLAHHADPSASALGGTVTPLSQAAYVGDAAVVQLLIDSRADVSKASPAALGSAILSGCTKCAPLLSQSLTTKEFTEVALFVAPPGGDPRGVRSLLDLGADPRGKDPSGNALLAMVAASDTGPVDLVRTLLEKGADPNAADFTGRSAVELARLRGAVPVIDLLLKAGARPAVSSGPSAPAPSPADSPRTAVTRSLPLLQRADAAFLHKSGCVSCHNNVLASMAVTAARAKGFQVDEQEADTHVKTISNYIETWRERALQGMGIPGDTDTISYILLGLGARNYPPNAATDALAHFVRNTQLSDGRWYIQAHRPPIESSDITVTATALRALKLYAPAAGRAAYDKSIQSGAAWLAGAQPRMTEEYAFKLFGLTWAGASQDKIHAANTALLATQREDGGWAQLATLQSDAYATGQALSALSESGAMPVTDPAYRKGVKFLLDTQRADGSWFVKSRAIPIQPYFESDFPYGHDQWISAAATGWATVALTAAVK
jgi:ankyrin repeat protein